MNSGLLSAKENFHLRRYRRYCPEEIGITIWNVRVLWRFVPFAASNLNFACKGIAVYAFEIHAMAICLALFAWLWVGAWIYVTNGYYSTFYGVDPTVEQDAYQDCYYETDCVVGGNWVGLFFLFLSLYWTISILLVSRNKYALSYASSTE